MVLQIYTSSSRSAIARLLGKYIYHGVLYRLPHQADVDDIIAQAKRDVISGTHLQVPNALPPPRGRPIRNADKKLQGWYEKRPAAMKRRSYSCSVFHREGHTAGTCQLSQLFDDSDERSRGL